tara:strand:- start:2351 stop:2755 length:405 start_codon:yes stop_codon:yes gene_type:complete
MIFVDATKNAFIRGFDFKSRCSRSEYWWGYLGILLVSIVGGFLAGVVVAVLSGLLGWNLDTVLNSVILVLQLYISIISVSLFARRMHDIDRSGWWYLLIFTVIGLFFILYWLCSKGDEGDNRFGTAPLLDNRRV